MAINASVVALEPGNAVVVASAADDSKLDEAISLVSSVGLVNGSLAPSALDRDVDVATVAAEETNDDEGAGNTDMTSTMEMMDVVEDIEPAGKLG